MKKLMFVGFMFVSLLLIAEEMNNNESNWISYDGWVTGPGSLYNNETYLLPFGYQTDIYGNDCSQIYTDDSPLLYETDMGWPVPDEEENNLKYLLFGDTFFFMRDTAGHIMSKITYESETLLNFGVENNNATEIERQYNFLPLRGLYSSAICDYCSDQTQCSDFCSNLNLPTYSSCVFNCQNLSDSNIIFTNYLDINLESKEEKCKDFCKFDMVGTYSSADYFAFNKLCNPEYNNLLTNYNTGTSNIFLAAEILDDTLGTGNETQYNIKFHNPDGGDSGPAQLHSTSDNRKSKSIWMTSYERGINGFVGIYPRGYFYACSGGPNDSCSSKKLFIPYNVGNWDFLKKENFCTNWFNNPGNINVEIELKRQKEELGIGIYDFDNECRIRFSDGSDTSFPTCSVPDLPDDEECFREEENYPNKHILWPHFSKMSSVTVIHDLDRDIFSIDDKNKYDAGYIYFMGTGETEVDTSTIVCPGFGDIVSQRIEKAYIARVPAYENKIKCPASYEYFKGITNGIARWSKNMEDAVPLYGFYPLNVMGAESIVKHRDLYWMTAPLNETTATASHEIKKGVVVLASPDAFHWQKVDTILFENPDRIWLNYAFFWLPPKLIETGDNTMPFLYSIWKSNSNGGKLTLSSFINDNWNSKFTRYNLKSGKYKFMEEKATRAFLVNDTSYGIHLKNTIPGNTANDSSGIFTNLDDNPILSLFYSNNGTIALPFKSFQNLDNLVHTDSVYDMDFLKNRYVLIEYCYCGEQDEEQCTKFETGNCYSYQKFITERGEETGNWKIIDIVDDDFFQEYVLPCKNGNENIPDYMCNIPFEHSEQHLPEGHKNVPVWNWRAQITKDLGLESPIESAKVILRFSHWDDISSEQTLPFEQGNYTKINKQLMENNKLIPFDCKEELDDDDEYDDEDENPDNDADSDEDDLIEETCQNHSSWRTTRRFLLKYKKPFDPSDWINFDLNSIRLEYLYPYPVMIHDFGRPGDPAPDIWDMLVADHFSREFFKVSSFEYAASSLQTLTSGAAATAVIQNGQMQIYAWGGAPSVIPRSTSQAGILYVGTYNPETEVVTFMSEILDETEEQNPPALTVGASMVYDDENDKIYLIGALDQNGMSRIYRLADARSGRKWESVATIDLGRYFRLVKKSEHEYFAFGGQTGETSFSTKLYLLDLNNMTSPQLITKIPTSGLANSFAAYSEMDQKLYIFGGQDSNGASDRILSFDTKTATWNEINAVGGPGAGFGGVILVDYITETISLGGGVFVNNEDRNFKWIFDPKTATWTKELKSGSYCLKESETAVQGGIGTSGECVPFTHPWYNSFSAGATVYSLDGKGERLYVGTNNAIKVYDISDPIAPVLVSSFSTSSRVNDLEVYGNTLFAATNSGLYKLDASDPDELTQVLFVSATLNYQYKVEVYNGKLYVGDDNGIKIRDLETLSVLTSVNNGSVLDFAIENGEIGLYKDALFSPVEIRDAETLTLKANEFFGCFEIEVGSSDGRFYLSCDDETYRFEDDGDGGISFTELSGDIRELQDVYTYNGYSYMYDDENTIWISTNNDVPALCGNGIVEGDEVCDGAPIECTELDSNYVSGTATCNATCDGYNTNNCSDDGW